MVVQILAHRGASRAERENTVAAFRRAREMGADAVELDVRRSSDGILVVHHDPFIGADRRPISATPRAELPAHVPDLDQALDACAGLWVNVEIKNDPSEPDFDPSDHLVDPVVAALAARGEDARWLISSFRLGTIDRCRLLSPSIATAWLTEDIPADLFERLLAGGHRAWHPQWELIDEARVRVCHDAGVAVNVWTCDDPAAILRMEAWNVDGICTNVPDVALRTLRRRT